MEFLKITLREESIASTSCTVNNTFSYGNICLYTIILPSISIHCIWIRLTMHCSSYISKQMDTYVSFQNQRSSKANQYTFGTDIKWPYSSLISWFGAYRFVVPFSACLTLSPLLVTLSRSSFLPVGPHIRVSYFFPIWWPAVCLFVYHLSVSILVPTYNIPDFRSRVSNRDCAMDLLPSHFWSQNYPFCSHKAPEICCSGNQDLP